MIRLMKRRALRWLAAVGLGVLLATFGVVGVSDASAANAPFEQPSWLGGNGGERWPIHSVDVGYQNMPGALTRWSKNGMSGNYAANPTLLENITKQPRVWAAEPFQDTIVGDEVTTLRARLYVQSGQFKTQGVDGGGYSPLQAALLCQSTTTGLIKYKVQNYSGSTIWYRDQWYGNLTVSEVSYTMGAFNPCSGTNQDVFVGADGADRTTFTFGTGYEVVGIQWRLFDYCTQSQCLGATQLDSTIWLPSAKAAPVTPSFADCVALFGQKYAPTSQVNISGTYFTAAQLGCAEYMDTVNPEGDWATDFSFVCSNPPAASWTSFDWLPLWMEHYTNCLFVPQIGFPVQQVSSAVSASGIGDVSTVMGDIGESLPSGEECGVLVDASGTVLDGLKISTCSWTWAGPMKTVLTAAVWILTIVGSVWLLVRTITGGAVREGGDE